MKIVMATPVVYDRTSPFNHLLHDLIGAFLEDGNSIVRLVACEDWPNWLDTWTMAVNSGAFWPDWSC